MEIKKIFGRRRWATRWRQRQRQRRHRYRDGERWIDTFVSIGYMCSSYGSDDDWLDYYRIFTAAPEHVSNILFLSVVFLFSFHFRSGFPRPRSSTVFLRFLPHPVEERFSCFHENSKESIEKNRGKLGRNTLKMSFNCFTSRGCVLYGFRLTRFFIFNFSLVFGFGLFGFLAFSRLKLISFASLFGFTF